MYTVDTANISQAQRTSDFLEVLKKTHKTQFDDRLRTDPLELVA